VANRMGRHRRGIGGEKGRRQREGARVKRGEKGTLSQPSLQRNLSESIWKVRGIGSSTKNGGLYIEEKEHRKNRRNSAGGGYSFRLMDIRDSGR